MLNTAPRVFGLAAGLGAGLGMVHAPSAEACGGFFCNNISPVVQTGERIIFAVDTAQSHVEAIINITYQGGAPEFAWVLPLPSAPERIRTGSSYAFNVAEQLTAPRWTTTFRNRGTCAQPAYRDGASSDSASASASDAAAPTDVTVLQQSAVGPYDSVVIQSSDPASLRTWLGNNGYNVTDAMMRAVVPYVAQGDVLLALKLRKDESAGDIQPIQLTLRSREACIPIRLTAIAAQDDMDITAIILSAEGRAIPKNYNHFIPNPTRINWLSFGSNYKQLVGDAADEAGGNAFTTEYAGSSSIFRGRVDVLPGNLETRLRETRNLGQFFRLVQGSGLLGRKETRGILQRHITDEILRSLGIDPRRFWFNPFSYNLDGAAFDPSAAADDFRDRILVPDREAQGFFDTFPYATRLFTLISPEEMNLDPIFEFRPNLPEVSNVHRATVTLDCGNGGYPGSAGRTVELEDGTTYQIDASGNAIPRRPDFKSSAAVRIEQLATGEIIKTIPAGTGLEPGGGIANGGGNGGGAGNGGASGGSQDRLRSDGCACSAAGTTDLGGFGGALLASLLLAAGLKRRRAAKD